MQPEARERWHKWLDELLDLAEKDNLKVLSFKPAEVEVAVKGRGKKKEHVIKHDFSLSPNNFKSQYRDGIGHMTRFRSVTMFLMPRWCLEGATETEPMEENA